ncbi:Uma2 family endonuclease [Marinactinospora rubrisoli]|uniref:Uma2 family endonuclease n=1 Tax=Marinactinospora rubrisoli TaxID=2715399 RepID=A0ABW2KE66_9ACTN
MIALRPIPRRPARHQLTVDDLADVADNGERYELVAGQLDVSPAPPLPHVRMQTRLCWLLCTAASGGFEVQTGPGLVLKRGGEHHRIPDVCVKRDEPVSPDPYGYHYLTHPPLLAVEIVSPASSIRDYEFKTLEYARFGIPAYWIVDIASGETAITELRRRGEDYHEVRHAAGTEVFETDHPFPVRMVPRWLLADGDWRSHLGGRETTGSRA